MLRQTDWTDNAGDQSSVRMDRQMWPLLYTCGCTGMLGPRNVTCSVKEECQSSHRLRLESTARESKLPHTTKNGDVTSLGIFF